MKKIRLKQVGEPKTTVSTAVSTGEDNHSQIFTRCTISDQTKTQENNYNKLTNAIHTTNQWWIDWCYLSQQSNKISCSSHQQKTNKSDEFWLQKWCPNNGTLWKNISLHNSIKFSYLDDISTKVLQTYGQNTPPPPSFNIIQPILTKYSIKTVSHGSSKSLELKCLFWKLLQAQSHKVLTESKFRSDKWLFVGCVCVQEDYNLDF